MSDIKHALQHTIQDLAATIINKSNASNGRRILVAIAGPPGAGKSTISQHLCDHLNTTHQHSNTTHQPSNTTHQPSSVVVPMDGFHLDNCILRERGLLSRKGSPPTFDVEGFRVLLERLRDTARTRVDVVIPVFDRALDLARAGGSVVQDHHRILLIEGNYLLVDEAPWSGLHQYFDLTVFVEASREELERRLIRRWDDFDYKKDQAKEWVMSNDMPNVDFTLEHSVKASKTIRNE